MSWDTYAQALQFNAEQARLEREQPPAYCPNDGEALEIIGERRHCPADGWCWPEKRVLNRAGVS